MSRSDAPSILIVDDDSNLRERLAQALRARGFEVQTAGDYDEALALARIESPEMAVVDLRMPGHSGLELIRDLKALDAETKVLVLTGYGSIATTIDAMKLGAVYYLPKPADADDVLAAFARGGSPPAGQPERFRGAVAGTGQMGAHQPGPGRLRRKRLGGRAAPEPAPADPAADPAEVPAPRLKCVTRYRGCEPQRRALRTVVSRDCPDPGQALLRSGALIVG